MSPLLDILVNAKRANQLANDLQSRQPPYLGIVTNNRDPNQERRIKVTDAASPGVESHWLRRIKSEPYTDACLPAIGSTVLVIPVEGDATNGWYVSLENATDPPHPKQDAINDRHQLVPGDQLQRVGKNYTLEVGDSLTLKAGSVEWVFNSDGEGGLTLKQTGDVNWDFGNAALYCTNVLDFKINGKSVTVVGAPDTDGDLLTGRGY